MTVAVGGSTVDASDPMDAPRWRRPSSVAVAAWLLLAVPVVVALVVQRRHTWFPIADLAQTELRIRDVGGRHTPLMGLAGRIGDYADAGSHPGPLSFWLMAPTYRLLGSTAWAFQVSAAVLHLAAFALALWLAARRRSTTLVLAVAAGLAALTRFYGLPVLFEGWNPYLPVSWWVVFLLAVWAVLDDDLAALPIAILAGSICAQTHLPYVGLVGGLVVALVAVAAIAWWRGRPAEPEERRRRIRWVGGSVLLGLLLWTPPLVEQVTGTGNLGKVIDTLRHPTDAPSGVAEGLKALFGNLDPFGLVAGHLDLSNTPRGSAVPGLLLVLVWVAVAVIALRLRDRLLIAGHAVVAGALALAIVSATRVTGTLWFYLFLWARGLTVVVLVVTAATLVAALRRWRPATAPGLAVAAPLVALAVLVGSVGAATADATDGARSEPRLTAALGVLVHETVDALDRPGVLGGGRDGRYLVRWIDPLTLGSQGIGLVNELERRGFHVGVDQGFGPGAVRYRVLAPTDATGVLQLVRGPAIAAWDANPAATRIAYVDDRTPAQRAEYDRLDASIRARLLALGLDDIAAQWQDNLFTTAVRSDVPKDIDADMFTTITIGAPTAVYLLAPTP